MLKILRKESEKVLQNVSNNLQIKTKSTHLIN